jgi:hypothetical protein
MTATLAPRQGAGAAANEPAAATGRGRRLRRVWTGPATDPRWARPACWALLVATAALYLVNLTASEDPKRNAFHDWVPACTAAE